MPDARAIPADHGVAQVERRLVLIISVFGILYSLQNLDGLIADWPSMSDPLGVAVVSLVAGSCALALLAIQQRGRARQIFAVAVAAYALGVLLWPFAVHGAVPASPPPWLTSMWPVEAVYLCGVTSRLEVPLGATAAAAAILSVLLLGPGELSVAEVISAVLPMCAICAVLALLIAALRHRIRHAEQSRRTSLGEYQKSRRDAATEAERTRTDALVHDTILTTLLSAAAADSDEDEELASRMARNALRVVAHVNRQDAQEQVLPFPLLLQRARRIAPVAFAMFRVDADRVEAVALPSAAADAVLAAVVEAMDNSMRHAGDADRTLTAEPLGPDGVRVVIADSGVGFDAATALARTGSLQRAVVERMRQVYGRSDVVSAPAEGTRVTISWGSVVISGTRPLDDVGVGVR